MNRLSALDSLFLYLETPETPMHVASVTTFRANAPIDEIFERFRAQTAARLDLLPSYRRKLKPTPLNIDHPVWTTAEEVDLDYHIRRAALPSPGGMNELRAMIGELHARPLDRSRPLWEYHFIEGLEDGGFAVYVKTHHAAMDGLAGMASLGVIYDFHSGPDADPAAAPVVRQSPEPADDIAIAASAVGDFLRQGVRAVTGLKGTAQALLKAAPHFGRDAKILYAFARNMPRTPLNGMISRYRVYATASLPLARVKALSKARRVTINDVVLALCSGALRRWLARRGALPEKPLLAGVPASIRPSGDARLNNQVVFTLSSLPTDVADPLERLAAARKADDDAKALFADFRDLITTDVSLVGAPVVITALMRLWAGARMADRARSAFNVVISNVPGPREPFYCAGAEATHYFPVSIPFHGAAINMTVQSYLDTLDFGFIACAETVPDAQDIADAIVEDFAAMEAAAAQAGEAAAPDATAFLDRISAKLSGGAKPAPAGRTPDASSAAEAGPQATAGMNPLMRSIDALGAATEALRRKLAQRSAGGGADRKPAASGETPGRAKPRTARGKAATTRAAAKPAAAPKAKPAARAAPKAGAPRRAARRKAPAPADT